VVVVVAGGGGSEHAAPIYEGASEGGSKCRRVAVYTTCRVSDAGLPLPDGSKVCVLAKTAIPPPFPSPLALGPETPPFPSTPRPSLCTHPFPYLHCGGSTPTPSLLPRAHKYCPSSIKLAFTTIR